MSYSATRTTSVALKSFSPNLIYNNLAAAQGRLVYAHSKSATCVAYGGREVEITNNRVETKDLSYVQSICCCFSREGCVIVITTALGLQIWNGTGSLMLLNYEQEQKSRKSSDDLMEWQVTCSAGAYNDHGNFVMAGTSEGDMLIFGVDSSTGLAKYLCPYQTNQGPLSAMGSMSDSCRGAEASGTVATGDISGGIKVWEISTADSIMEKCSQMCTQGPVVGLKLRGNRVIAAFSTGVVQILSQATLAPEVEIFAHSRLLSGLAIHPTKDIFATVAEDSTLNVWRIPSGNSAEVGPLLSFCWPKMMLTGVAFCGRSTGDVAITAYDHDELKIFTEE